MWCSPQYAHFIPTFLTDHRFQIDDRSGGGEGFGPQPAES